MWIGGDGGCDGYEIEGQGDEECEVCGCFDFSESCFGEYCFECLCCCGEGGGFD